MSTNLCKRIIKFNNSLDNFNPKICSKNVCYNKENQNYEEIRQIFISQFPIKELIKIIAEFNSDTIYQMIPQSWFTYLVFESYYEKMTKTTVHFLGEMDLDLLIKSKSQNIKAVKSSSKYRRLPDQSYKYRFRQVESHFT